MGLKGVLVKHEIFGQRLHMIKNLRINTIEMKCNKNNFPWAGFELEL